MSLIIIYFSLEADNDGLGCYPDLGFVMDTAGSVSSKWMLEKEFILRLANRAKISKSGAHVAVTTFSMECPVDCESSGCPAGCPNNRPDAELMIKFSEHTSFSSFETAVKSLSHGGMGHQIDQGMDIALTQMFQKQSGMRISSPKTMVLVTDGHQSGVDYAEWAKLFENADVRVVVVGIGEEVVRNYRDFERLVKEKSDLHLVPSFSSLLEDSLVNNINLCEGNL